MSTQRISWKTALSSAGVACFSLQGKWDMFSPRPLLSQITSVIEKEKTVNRLVFNFSELQDFDSTLLTFLLTLQVYCQKHQITFDEETLPEGARGLLELAFAVPEKEGVRKKIEKPNLFLRVGKQSLGSWSLLLTLLNFLGELARAMVRCIRGQARTPKSELISIIQNCGPLALPIVSLISLLVGLILAYIGATQLAKFGAVIYTADLVGLAMVREMGGIMAGIIMAGRTGAAFAAQIGTMQVNEEIDALQTLGISAMEFLVLPRALALILMMPLLTIYASVMGIIGGLVVAVTALGISPALYLEQTRLAIGIENVWIGLIKAVVFGILVATSGCLYGLNCGRSASAVGHAVTSAVVAGIVSIVVADAIFAVLCGIIGV